MPASTSCRKHESGERRSWPLITSRAIGTLPSASDVWAFRMPAKLLSGCRSSTRSQYALAFSVSPASNDVCAHIRSVGTWRGLSRASCSRCRRAWSLSTTTAWSSRMPPELSPRECASSHSASTTWSFASASALSWRVCGAWLQAASTSAPANATTAPRTARECDHPSSIPVTVHLPTVAQRMWRSLAALDAARHGVRDLEEREERRSQREHEQRRKEADDQREDQLHRERLRLHQRVLPAAVAHVVGLVAQHVGQAEAALLRLHEARDERRELRHVHAAREAPQALHARHARERLALEVAELVGEVALALVGVEDLLHGRVEPQARLGERREELEEHRQFAVGRLDEQAPRR